MLSRDLDYFLFSLWFAGGFRIATLAAFCMLLTSARPLQQLRVPCCCYSTPCATAACCYSYCFAVCGCIYVCSVALLIVAACVVRLTSAMVRCTLLASTYMCLDWSSKKCCRSWFRYFRTSRSGVDFGGRNHTLKCNKTRLQTARKGSLFFARGVNLKLALARGHDSGIRLQVTRCPTVQSEV